MKIIIVGCGKVGKELAEQLNGEHHDLTVLDINPTVVQEISNKLDVMCVTGNGANYSVLVEAGVEDADLFIAMTGSDEHNLLCCIIANQAGNCDTIARIRNPLYSNDINQMRHKLGLAMVINPEQASAKEVAHVLKFPSALKVETFAKGRIEILMYKIKNGSKLHNLKLSDISTKLRCKVLICAIQRGDKIVIPDGSFVLNEGGYHILDRFSTELSAVFQAFKHSKCKNKKYAYGGRRSDQLLHCKGAP